MNNEIEITVLIVAYNREEFLFRALGSVLNQNFDLRNVEIIVLTNLPSIKLPSVDNGVKLKKILLGDGKIGEYIRRGITIAKGRIICFLDDDDLFEPSKLATVHRVFSNILALGYYRNRDSLIDIHEHLISKERGKEYLITESNKFYLKWQANLRENPFHNLSCISIRKLMVEPYLNVVGSIQYGIDLLFYCIAIDSNFSLLIGTEILTKYMVHSNTVFPPTDYNRYILKMQRTLTQYICSYRFLIGKFDNIQVKKLLNYFISLSSLKMRLISNTDKTKKNVLRDIAEVFVNGLLVKQIEPLLISMLSFVPWKNARARLYHLSYSIFLKTLTTL